jgi:hypothetical protein
MVQLKETLAQSFRHPRSTDLRGLTVAPRARLLETGFTPIRNR